MFFWLASKTVFSADASGDAISQEIPVPELTPTGEVGIALFKMILALLLLCAALFATLWLIRRFIHHRFQKGSGLQSIQILEKKMLSPKSMLYLVEVQGKKVLLAESQLEVRRLHWWHEEIPAEEEETED